MQLLVFPLQAHQLFGEYEVNYYYQGRMITGRTITDRTKCRIKPKLQLLLPFLYEYS